MTVRQGDVLTLAVERPRPVPHGSATSGRMTTSATSPTDAFTGYVPEQGVQLPPGYNTTMDWRNVVYRKLYVDRNIVDGPIDELARRIHCAPAAAEGAAATRPRCTAAGQVADHVWFMNGNTIFEFDDHLTMFEANRSDAALQTMLKV